MNKNATPTLPTPPVRERWPSWPCWPSWKVATGSEEGQKAAKMAKPPTPREWPCSTHSDRSPLRGNTPKAATLEIGDVKGPTGVIGCARASVEFGRSDFALCWCWEGRAGTMNSPAVGAVDVILNHVLSSRQPKQHRHLCAPLLLCPHSVRARTCAKRSGRGFRDPHAPPVRTPETAQCLSTTRDVPLACLAKRPPPGGGYPGNQLSPRLSTSSPALAPVSGTFGRAAFGGVCQFLVRCLLFAAGAEFCL